MLSKRLTWIFLCFNSSPLICTPARALPVSHNYDFCPICGFLFPSLIGKMEEISNSVPQMQQKMGSFLTLLPRTPLRRCFCPDSRLNPQDGYTQIRHHPPPDTDVPALQTPSSSTKSDCFPGCSWRPRGCFA